MMRGLSNRTRIILTAIIVIALGTFVYGGVLMVQAFQIRDQAIQKGATETTTNKAAATEACAQVERLDKTCVIDPAKLASGSDVVKQVPGVKGDTGATGATGPGPSFAQVVNALQVVIDDALTANCGGSCKSTTPGRPGKAGTNGTNGVSPPPAQDGKDGTDGTDGTDGDDGRGIASVSCANGFPGQTFTVTYDDGDTEEIPCTAAP